MKDIAILNDMIKINAKVQLIDFYNKKKVILKEPQCTQSDVVILGIPDQSLVIKADTFRSPDTIFAGSHGECKRADYIIVTETEKGKVIVFIEMKSSKATEKEIIHQLTGAQCAIFYFREIGKAFWNEKDFLEGFKHRFVSISRISINKRKTRLTRKTDIHDKPNKMLKISWPNNLQFSSLIGNINN